MAEQENNNEQSCCRYLTCKEMFYRDLAPGQVPRNGSGNFWCSLTQTLQGPDNKIAGPEECGPDRNCFESA
jgi:hypothetical protein